MERLVGEDRPEMTIYYVACTLPAGYPSIQTHTQHMQYLLLIPCNNGYTHTCLNITLYVLVCLVTIASDML